MRMYMSLMVMYILKNVFLSTVLKNFWVNSQHANVSKVKSCETKKALKLNMTADIHFYSLIIYSLKSCNFLQSRIRTYQRIYSNLAPPHPLSHGFSKIKECVPLIWDKYDNILWWVYCFEIQIIQTSTFVSRCSCAFSRECALSLEGWCAFIVS